MEEVINCIPDAPEADIPWSRIDQLLDATGFTGLKSIRQNPLFHGEGDVYTHTQMVCRELLRNPAFRTLTEQHKSELFLAAILHDIGKAKTTRQENGNWVSPHHALTGSQISRAFLWRNCNICGTQEMISYRETVCALVRWHMLPVHLLDQMDPKRKMLAVSAIGELASDFSWHLLCMLAEADMKGRTAEDIGDEIMQIGLTRMLAEEMDCLYRPYHFADGFTKRAYLSGRNVQPNQTLYNDTWGEVIIVSGLPGTGKDTWICRYQPNLPVVSLDDLRKEYEVKPTDNQGIIIQAAQEQARKYLREKQPFVWNATNLIRETRQKLVGLFEQYGASVRIVYLETDQAVRIARNAGRPDKVPEKVIAGMLDRTVLPFPEEAHAVEWICV